MALLWYSDQASKQILDLKDEKTPVDIFFQSSIGHTEDSQWYTKQY